MDNKINATINLCPASKILPLRLWTVWSICTPNTAAQSRHVTVSLRGVSGGPTQEGGSSSETASPPQKHFASYADGAPRRADLNTGHLGGSLDLPGKKCQVWNIKSSAG